MRMHKLYPAIAAIITAALIATFAIAQPSPGFSKTAPISGTGSNGSPLKLDVCPNGSAYISNGTNWACGTAGGSITTSSDFDGDGTGGDPLDLSTAVTAPGTLTVAGNTTLGDSTSADQTTVNGALAQTSTGAAAATGAVFTKTTVGSTTSYAPAIHAINDGTYDTTASALNAIAVFGECNASISAGANALVCTGVYGYDDGGSSATDRIAVRGVTSASSGTNITAGAFLNLSTVNTYKMAVQGISQGNSGTKYGGYFGASGTGTNWALYTAEGDVALNVSSGSTQTFGNTTLGDAAGDALTINGTLTANGTAGSDGDVLTRVAGVPQWAAAASGGVGVVQTIATCGHDNALNADTTIVICNGGGFYGFTGGVDGRMLYVIAGTVIGTAHEAAGSTAANRISLTSNSASLIVNTYQVMTLIYDGTASRWKTNDQIRFAQVYSDSSVDAVTTLTAGGNVTLGDATTDTVTVAGDLRVDDATTLKGDTSIGDNTADNATLTGHLYVTSTAPSVATCGSGPDPVIAGSDNGFYVTVGSAAAVSGCAVTFSRTHSTRPACTWNYEGAGSAGYIPNNVTVTATGITFDGFGGVTYDFTCLSKGP